ncbi:MAG TPA: thiopurine S-methyltransferase [Sulfurivirga caldicuralii]|nr:thiopurine S-methyltransferase [Sulfurivirga caldicuralii]
MDQSFWMARWRQGQTGWHLSHPNPLLVKYWDALTLPPGAQVFVPLCGKSEDMVWLAQQGYRVLGNELCQQAVAAFFAERGLEPTREALNHQQIRWQAGPYTLIEGDFFRLTPTLTAQVAAVYDRAALVALPPPQRAQYARALRQLVPAGSGYLLISLEGPVAEQVGPPFSVPEREIRRLFAALPSLQHRAVHPHVRKGENWEEHVWLGRF